MNSTRDLHQGLTGTDVTALQASLTQLSYEIPLGERQEASFGAGTLAAVGAFQSDHGLSATGIVDQDTAMVLSEVIRSSTYTIQGAVRCASHPCSGLAVRAVDKNVGGDSTIAATTTDLYGKYVIQTVIPSVALNERRKDKPDLQVHVLDGTSVLGRSHVAYSAPQSVILDVTLPSDVAGLKSEFDCLTATISSLYTGPIGALQENDDRQDITYLGSKSGWDARAVALAALASQLAQPTIMPPPAPPDPGSIRVEFYYALLRAGLPADVDSLFRTPWKTVKSIWQQAIEQEVIPQSLAEQLDGAVQVYQKLAAGHLLTAAPPVGVSTLSEMLQLSLPDPAKQGTFSALYAQSAGDWSAFWNSVQQSFGPATTQKLQLDGKLLYLSINNAPLVSALYTKEANSGSGLTSIQDLATRGYYESEKWAALIGESVPEQIPGATLDERKSNYASFLAAQVSLSFPALVAADQVLRQILPIINPAIRRKVTAFLQKYANSFSLGTEPVEAFIAREEIPAMEAEVVTQIKRLQRVYQLTPDDQAMSVLLYHNIDSASAVTRYGKAGFMRAFQDKVGGVDKAARIYARAQHIYSAVINIASNYLTARQGPTLGERSVVMSTFQSSTAAPNYPVVARASLETLFGSQDYCNCEDCRSILSPAAYLVDLLHFLDQPSPSPSYQNPQDVLFQRRPDLQYLPLTCANTNTGLPYIDVVNETLEYCVANAPTDGSTIGQTLSLTNFQGYSTGDTVTSEELLASPQNVNDAAYTRLQNTFFPPPLPFNRPLMLLRQLFQSMGIELDDAMAKLRIRNATRNSTAISLGSCAYNYGDVLLEQLGLSRDEYQLFTNPTPGGAADALHALYGYPTAIDALGALQAITLQAYSRRTGISYADLVSILETTFINPNAIFIPRLKRLNVPFSAITSLHNDPTQASAFKAALPADLDAREYGGGTARDFDAVVRWVTDNSNYAKLTSIITLTNSISGVDECSGSAYQFLYTDQTPLSAADFLRLIRFIRLWQKLGLTIEQTDATLTALYPASASSPEVAFQIAMLRIGVLLQVLKLLGISPDKGLAPLLACWAPIGIAGANSLYRQMFSGPAIAQEDPGAQIAIITGAPNATDILQTFINAVEIDQPVGLGDTAVITATHIGAAINACVTTDPTTNLPLNSRIAALSDGNVVTIRAGCTFSCSVSTGASVTYTASIPNPLSQSAVVGGIVTPGDVLTTSLNTVSVAYTAIAGDTWSSIATNIAVAINATTSADPYSGVPLNNLVIATASGAVVTVTSANSGGPFSLSCAYEENTAAGSYTVGALTLPNQTLTLAGTLTGGDQVLTTINSVPISYTIVAADTAASAIANIAAVINATATTDTTTGLALNVLATASASGNVLTIASSDPAMPITVNGSVTRGTETYTHAGPFPATQSATVAGTFAPGVILTSRINGVTIPYPVVGVVTAAMIATNIAALINATTTVDPVSGVALNTSVAASAAGNSLTVKAIGTVGAFAFAVSSVSAAYTAGRRPAPFADDGYGNYLADATQTIIGHEPILRAAFNLTGSEFDQIVQELGYTSSTPLTLANISSIFRIGWFSRALQVSVREFLLLRQMSGLDPFTTLDPSGISPVEPSAVLFIRMVQAMAVVGLRPVQALYLLWNQDLSGKSSPPFSVIGGLATTLRAAFAAVDAQFALQSDPDGSVAKKLMALVYGADATEFFFGLLNDTFTCSASYPDPTAPGPQPPPPPAVLSASNGRLTYDDLRKQLTFWGVLDGPTFSAVDAAISANGDVQGLHMALRSLAAASQNAVGPFFTRFPELLAIYKGYMSSSDPPEQRRAALLAKVLPDLIRDRDQQQAMATVTAAAGTDPSFASELLLEASILHAAADASQPVISDFTALRSGGLAVQWFLSNDPSSTADIVVDVDGPISYGPTPFGLQHTATIGGLPTAGDTLYTYINGLPVPYRVAATDTTITAVANGIALQINATTTPDPISGLPLNAVVTASAVGSAVTVKASNLGAAIAFACQATLTAPLAIAIGPQVLSSQTLTVGGTPAVGDVLTTTINAVSISYSVVAGDTSLPILAAHIVAAINATLTVDPVSGLPLNQIVMATSSGGGITVSARAFGRNVAVSCSASGAAGAVATETYVASAPVPASQALTLSGTTPANDAVAITINGVTVSYNLGAGDTSLSALAGNLVTAINSTAAVDPVSGQPLNVLVTASSTGGVVTISASNPGVPFTIACSVVLGSYTSSGQVPTWKSALLAGGLTPADVLTTTINGIALTHTVGAADKSLTALATNIASDINNNAATSKVVTASSVGSVITLTAVGSSGSFDLLCTASSGATETYGVGPQLLAWQAQIGGGFAAGDILTTVINGVALNYPVGLTDTTAARIATNVTAMINASTLLDPASGLPINRLVVASSTGATITVRPAESVFLMSGAVSAGASETYIVDGEVPAVPGGGLVAGTWSGHLDASQDGYYDLAIDTDPGCTVLLSVNGSPITLDASANGSVWSNQSPIFLTAGELTSIAITATSLIGYLSLSWQSTGLGRQVVPAASLYSEALIDRLQVAYIRFLKVTSLASLLSLTAKEIAYLGTNPQYAINTSSSDRLATPGPVTVTPASMSNIAPSTLLVIDSGPAQEVIQVSTINSASGTFSATTTKAHDGTAHAFAIADLPAASTGQGWPNLLSVSPPSTALKRALPVWPSYEIGAAVPASQSATVGGTTLTVNDVLTTTVNTIAISYPVTAADTSVGAVAANIVKKVNATTDPDPTTGLPLNQVISASSAGAVITIGATRIGPRFSLSCSTQGVGGAPATETYAAGPFSLAYRTANLYGDFPAQDILLTRVNSVLIPCPVTAGNLDDATMAARIVAAINASTAIDALTGQPVNSLVSASNSGSVITFQMLTAGMAPTLSCSVASFRDVLMDLVNFARLKAVLSPTDDRLLQLFRNPAALSADGLTPQVIKVTGWSEVSLAALLQHFFGNQQLSNLASIEWFRWVYEAQTLVANSRLSAAALIAATTNAPTPATTAALQSALRAGYAKSDWLRVIQPVSDRMRTEQRDALVAFILQRLGDAYAGSLITLPTSGDATAGSNTLTLTALTVAHAPTVSTGMAVQGLNIPAGTVVLTVAPPLVTLNCQLPATVPSGTSVTFVPTSAVDVTTADDLYQYFLIDVLTQPPVDTSRIRLALSSVQLFVERILRNLEPQILPTDIDAGLWQWMKRYRVWQANREVFLWPENWLYPELRDDQSPIFQQMMSELLQGDITDDAAATAYLNYLSNLEQVAKLEPCGVYYVPSSNDSNEVSYVVARSAGAHRKHYFRQLQNGSWTPWTEINIDCEDAPLTPMVWNGRLLLFWLKVLKASTMQDTKPATPLTGGSPPHNTATPIPELSLDDMQGFRSKQLTERSGTVSAVLCWSEYYNGKWQPQKSSELTRPTVISTALDSFDADRSIFRIDPVIAANRFTLWGIVYTVDPSTVASALLLRISSIPFAPGINGEIPTTGGFVVFNTHSLPVRWEDVSLPVSGFEFKGLVTVPWWVVPSGAPKTFQPHESYSGGTPSDPGNTGSASFTISYWQQPVVANTPFGSAQYTSVPLKLIQLQRIVDCQPDPSGWTTPFMFEDRRNAFFVRSSQSMQRDLAAVMSFGSDPTTWRYGSTAPTVPPLTITSDLSVSDTVRIRLNSVSPVSYQGVAIYADGRGNVGLQSAIRATGGN